MATTTRSSATPVAQRAGMQPLILAALILAGFNLRTLLLEVPPILPQIQHDLGLNYTATGLLNALPSLLLGGLAYPAALLIRRLGAAAAVAWALAAMTLTTLLRAFVPGAVGLFVMTALMSAGIALGQTAMPQIVGEYFPRFIGQVTATYSTGLMVGEVVASALTVPLILVGLAGGQWRGTFVVWTIPVALGLLLWLLAVPWRFVAPLATDGTAMVMPATRRPMREIILSSIVLGSASMLFFGMDTWIPIYFHHLGRTDISQALTALAVGQLPASLALMAWGQHITGRPLGFIIGGALAVLAMVGWFFGPASWDIVLAGAFGAATAILFILGLAQPAYLATGSAVAQVTGITLTIGYSMAFIGPFLGGVLGDLTHQPITVFIPLAAGCVLSLVLGALLPDLRQKTLVGAPPAP
jgi:CP family cyanate transporter-like MFS transporter